MPRQPRTRKQEVIVFTEGEATEVSYVDAIKHLQERFVIRVDDRHGDPSFLVTLAIEHKHRLTRLNRDEASASEEPRIWCIFDRDQHPNIDNLVRQATEAGIRIAFSHPCFELWLLLHFRVYGAPSAGACERLVDLVSTHVPTYKRRGKRVSLTDLAGRYQQARQRASGLRDQHDRDGVVLPTRRDPSTSVWELVDSFRITY